jgi:sulfatase modifying factor 1
MKGILRGLALGCVACISQAAEPKLQIDLGEDVHLDLVLVPAGSFTQGSPANEGGRSSDESQRPVRISKDFYIAQGPVTYGQWERFVAQTSYRTEAETGTSGGYGWNGTALEQRKAFIWRNPGFQQDPDSPVCLVTYPDALAFCAWLEKKTRRKITLPTEAQWEYACRAGTTTPWHSPAGAGSAWHKENAGKGTHPSASKPANPWGLSIGGNISEWCLDWYGPYPAGEAVDPRQDNSNLSDKPRRVLRGGSWNRGANNTRSAARYRADPRSRNADIGFRIACSAEAPAPVAVPPARDLPPVESESSQDTDAGDPAAPTYPEPASHDFEDRESKPSSGFSLIKGLFCFLVPILILVKLIRGAARKGPPVPPSDQYMRRPIPAAVPPVRKVDDGFWIQGDWPEGTALQVRYMVAGAMVAQEILYRPGEQGQFIFTGSAPDTISVLAGADPRNSTETSLFSGPPPMQRRDDDDNDRRRPPTRPSAY